MSCSFGYGIGDQQWFQEAKAVAARLQPRQSTHHPNRRTIPYGSVDRQSQSQLLDRLPLDCRLLVWQNVLGLDYSRIERWRPDYSGDSVIAFGVEALDAECFPYRLITAGQDKSEKPYNLLLCCRQTYSEGVEILYSSTTFIFSAPMDLHSFRLTTSPVTSRSLRSIILTFDPINHPGYGPLCLESNENTQRQLAGWESAFQDLQHVHSLQHLQILLRHLDIDTWGEGQGNEQARQRQRRFFEVLGTVEVPDYTIILSWRPEDLLEQREWPFKTEFRTREEVGLAIDELPGPTWPDLYD